MFGLNRANNAKYILDDAMIDSFFEAADSRKARPVDRDGIIDLIKSKNSYRWWRLNHDYKWLRKEMKRLGYNPDDARELL